MLQITKEEWNNKWEKHDGILNIKDHFYLLDEILYEYLLSIIKKPCNSIEVGCGSGRMSSFLAKDGFDITLVDFSFKAIKIALKNMELIKKTPKAVLGDGFKLPFKNSAFDLVVSGGVLEHFENPIPMMKEMIRVIKSNGIFFAEIVPKKTRLIFAFDFMMDFFKGPEPLIEYKFSKKKIISMCEQLGLKKLVVFPFGVLPPRYFPFKQRIPYFLEIESWILYKSKPFFKIMDDTFLAELLGFGYFVCGYKP